MPRARATQIARVAQASARLVGVLLVALVLSWLLAFDSFRIAASSMAPTLKTGDRVLVFTPSYGFRPPFFRQELIRWAEPQRGDIIVFRIPSDESRHYIKRVIAVPGDTIEVRGTDVIVNGAPLPRREVSNPAVAARIVGRADFDGTLFSEDDGAATYYVQYSRRDGGAFRRNAGPRHVAEHEYFVLGDNRDDSDDSRSYGAVTRANIQGKVQVAW
jgi:signal peptidase I